MHPSLWLALQRFERLGVVLLFTAVLLLLVLPWAEPYQYGRALLVS